MKKILSFLILFLICFFFSFKPTFAADLYYHAKVVKIIEDKSILVQEATKRYQKLELQIVDSRLEGEPIVILENGLEPVANQNYYQINDWIYLTESVNSTGKSDYQIADYDRSQSMFLLFIVFIVLVLIISSWHGLRSILSMILSFFVIFFFILPNLYGGSNPYLIVSLGIIFIIPSTFYLSHGFNRKTTSAILGTIISLLIAVGLSLTFINLTKLSGASSEESGFLLSLKPGLFNFKSLLLSGIIIGVLGVIDDITISQSAIVAQLKINNPKNKKTFSQAMNIGKDHISSMINTLVLVYAGASLPLLLLFVDSNLPLSQLISFEPIAEEIVRTLIGSITLIIAVPITTLIATQIIKN